jgi:hypothetical protein
VGPYTVVVDARKALASRSLADERRPVGIGPLQLWLDSQWRPVRVIVADTRASVVADASYDVPVAIVAPPRDQIGLV